MSATKSDIRHQGFLDRVARSWAWFLACGELDIRFDRHDRCELGYSLINLAMAQRQTREAQFAACLWDKNRGDLT